MHAEITPDERRRARDLVYCTALEQLPDTEIDWEMNFWRRAKVEDLAAICERVLTERREWGLSLAGGASADDLDLLLQRMPSGPVTRLVEDDGLSLVSALRVVFHAGQRL